ncbi:hypothetical protein BGX23_001320 [Mortierella sp. AD031]|nr:hypothetical protein BGX23_001320 [Mortierella sp. AD031]
MAAVSSVGHPQVGHLEGGHSAKVEAVGADTGANDAALATDTTDTTAEADPAAAAADPPLPQDVAEGGAILPPPSGPRTPAEEKADSVLACMEGCAGAAACENQCITTGYNVPTGPVPTATVVPPPPVNATPTATVAAPPTTTVATATTTPKGSSGASSLSAMTSYRMVGAVVVVAVASLFVGL